MTNQDLLDKVAGSLKEFEIVSEIQRVRQTIRTLLNPYTIHLRNLNSLGSRFFRGGWDKDLPGDVVKDIEEQLEILQVLENFLAYINHIENMGNRKFTYGPWDSNISAEISVLVRVRAVVEKQHTDLTRQHSDTRI